jgi:hypothetical protein
MAKPKQQTLTGMEQATHSVLDEIAERLDKAQTEWQRWQKFQMAERELLKIKMQEFGVSTYKLKNGKRAVLDAGEPKAYLRKDKDFEEDEAENAEPTAEKQVAILRKNQPKQEPTEEESAENVEAFFDNEKASAEVAEAISAEVAEAISADLADDFTAEKCDECQHIDGAHTADCSKASGLNTADYLAYAKFLNVKSANSWARKWELDHTKDALIKLWLAEGKEQATTRIKKNAPKKVIPIK